MIPLKRGQKVRIRETIKGHETDSEVIATGAGVIVTCESTLLIERFDEDGWNVVTHTEDRGRVDAIRNFS